MTSRATFWRRRLVALTLVAATAAGGVAALRPAAGETQEGGLVTPVPVLGAADARMVLMGAAPQAAGGEAWGYRLLSTLVPPPVADGERLTFGPRAGERPQLAFLRAAGGGPWQIAQTPLDAGGRPYRGPEPNAASARVTARGGGVLVGRDAARADAERLVVLVRDPGKRYREIKLPAGTTPQPGAVLAPGETIALDQGAGRVAVGAFDGGTKTHVLFGALGVPREQAIVNFDGATFTREPIRLPASATTARIVAIDTIGADAAFALVDTNATAEDGIELYRRFGDGASAFWARQGFGQGGAPFTESDTPARAISDVAPLGGNADPLTVTPDGIWIDGSLRTTQAGADPVESSFTLFVSTGSYELTGSWCDALDGNGDRVCERDLGIELDRATGYRSFAWGGARFGTRIVTNPLEPGGTEETNRGTYLRFAGESFRRQPGGTGNGHPTAAFTSVDDGWLEGPVRISTQPRPSRLVRWPVALRSVLTAAAAEPGKPVGATDAQALAVGADGAVARFVPGQGWTREFLLTASGAVARPRLRGVAWPEPGRAHAVGDAGAMWQWRADTQLWERDPATPIGFEGQLVDVAFQPGRPDRGFAVGRAGTLLRYDKTWTQDAVPAEASSRDLTSVSFAGGQALATAGPDLLVEDGAGWRPDPGVRALLAEVDAGDAQLLAVRGLPDGGAVAAGRDFVLVRDSASSPWRFTDQPLPEQTIIAVAPVRDGDRVRALVSVVPRVLYPEINDPPATDPNVPAPLLGPLPLPPDGYLLREADGGWRDEVGTAYEATTIDRPIKSDPVLALLVDAGGAGWAIGGWGGDPDFAGRGTRVGADKGRVQTAGIFRYQPSGDPAAPPSRTDADVPLPDGPVRLAFGGHAQCERACADLADQDISPDRVLTAALDQAAGLAAKPGGPKAFLYTGGRIAPEGGGLTPREARRYADLLTSRPGLPVLAAPSAGDTVSDEALAFSGAFAAAPAPFGQGAAPAGVSTQGIPGIAASTGARTHYAFELGDGASRVRVVVIDNSRGSLAESDPYQNPAEQQLPWLRSVLADAKARGIPSIVVGSRDLSRFSPRLNAATDGDEVAQVLVENGASAYFFERPEENRAVRIPSGAEDTIPAFGTGTLGYRSPFVDAAGRDIPLALFGDRAWLLAELDVAKRDAATNRIPVAVRGIPVVEDLSLQAVDGTLLRRSRPSLFQGLARKPESGDRWGEASGDAGPSPPGGDPYTLFPADPCISAGCASRVTPEFEFTSSDPDIGDFVRQDPDSTNLRKPFIDPATDKVVTDTSSGLFCPFNAGETTVTIKAGGVAFAQKVTVLAGTAQRPCGTRPLAPTRFANQVPAAPVVQPPALPQVQPTAPPVPEIPLPQEPVPPPPPPPAEQVREPRPERRERPRPPEPPPPLPAAPLAPILSVPGAAQAMPPAAPPPPAGGFARPIPPGGVGVRVFEEKREEEVAPEQSQAYARYEPSDTRVPYGPTLIAAIVLLAAAGAELRNGPRRRARRRLATATVRSHHDPYRRPR